MAEAPQVSDAISLRWYVAVLRERWRVVAAGAITGVLVASAFLVLTEKSYVARTVVSMSVIGSLPTGPSDAASRLIDTTTEIELASSFEVASRASEVLGGNISAREIRDNVSVTTVADATVLVVNFAAASEQNAREGADAVAQGYLDYRSAVAAQRIEDAVDFIEVRATELRIELDELAGELASQEPDSEGELRVETDRSILLESLRTLLGQQFELERIDTSAGRVISPAVENYVEVSPSRGIVLASGLFGGVLLGAVAAFVANATSRTVASQRQLAALLGRRSLGEVFAGETAHAREDVDAGDVRAAAARLGGGFADEHESLVVFDAAGDSTPTVLPFLIAASVAQARRPINMVVVGLTEADQARVIESLRLTPIRTNLPKPGSARAAGAGRRRVFRMPISSRVRVLFARLDGGPSEFEGAVDQARERQQRSTENDAPLVWLVVTDMANLDARLMAMQGADAAVLLSRLGSTRRRSVEEFVEMSERFGCDVLGSLTAVPTWSYWRGGERWWKGSDRDTEERSDMASAS